MRVRFRLNEQRVAEMLRGIDPESLGSNFVTVTAGLLGCIGDIASLKFMPVFEGDFVTDTTSLPRFAAGRAALPSGQCSGLKRGHSGQA